MYHGTKKTLPAAIFAAGLLALSACNTTQTVASGDAVAPAPTAADAGASAAAAPQSASSIPDGKARIVVYRVASWGLVPNLMSPMVKLDNVAAAPCDLKRPIVRNVSPGAHDVSMQTDVIARRSVTLAAGETAYFKCLILPVGLILNGPMIEQVPFNKVPASVRGL